MFENLDKIKINPKNLKIIPDLTGIYIYWNDSLVPIYIGKAVNLKRRVNSYFLTGVIGKTKKMIEQAKFISYILVTSELEALLLEAKLVKKFNPQYNIQLKDDKNPLYIKITTEKYPRIITARKSDSQKGSSFGPFVNSANVKNVLKMVRKIFPYSDHKLGKKSCIYKQIGLCDPCPNEIEASLDSTEKNRLRLTYLTNIRSIKNLLNGNFITLRKTLDKNMKHFSSQNNFEEALKVRKKIERLNYVTQPINDIGKFLTNPNFFEDIKKNETDQFKKILNLKGMMVEKLDRIECYDISHISGEDATASMVTFIRGAPDKKEYRHFKINPKKYGRKKADSDTTSLYEVAERRLKHFTDWGKPDLIVVDGGKGQLSEFLKVFGKSGVSIVGFAKREERLVIRSDDGSFKLFGIKKYKPSYNLVKSLINEAHRFARRYHHLLVTKSLLKY